MAEKDERRVTLASLRGKAARGRRGGTEESASAADEAAGVDVRREQMGLLFADQLAATTAREMEPREHTEVRAKPVTEGGDGPGSVDAASPPGMAFVAVPRALPPQSWPMVEEKPWRRKSVVEPVPAASREPYIWTVRGIVADLRERVEGAHREVLIEGEISTCRPAASGHLYLSLREGEAQLSVVLFRRQAQLLRFRPTTGMAVLARGRLSVYEGRGELQLVAESLEPRGTGALLLAFERLKERLAAEGLFALERKRALPAFPKTVGIVTSTAGAVLHDVITVVRRRHPRLNLLVYPAKVQGPGCAASVAAGVAWFNRNPGLVEIILLARGGGSPEDLCGFNDEALARAIARSALPVVSAIGHETDFSIADFVADVRAPTPSAAAEIITASQHGIEERLEALERRLRRAGRMRVLEARQRFSRASAEQVLRRVQTGVDRRGQRLDDLGRWLTSAILVQQRGRWRRLEVLERGLERQQVGTRLARDRERLGRLGQRLRHAAPVIAARRRSIMERVAGRLLALSPVAVLARGYALVYIEEAVPDGIGNEGTQAGEEKAMTGRQRLVRSSGEVLPGQRVVARFAQGSVAAEVLEIDPE